jgi:hypothetical protein
LRDFGVQNLFCVIYGVHVILRGLDKTQFMTMLSITLISVMLLTALEISGYQYQIIMGTVPSN